MMPYPSWWKERKHFSYLVYNAQNPQALNAEKLHMQKPKRDVPQTCRNLENEKVNFYNYLYWIQGELLRL